MAGTATETIPAMWDVARDVAFFQMTVGLFGTAFCFGASVLLASYDDEVARPARRPTDRDWRRTLERDVQPGRLPSR
jgi:hypothetical protein